MSSRDLLFNDSLPDLVAHSPHRVIVYRVMAPGQTRIDREWHRMRQVHLDEGCARRHLRRRSTMVRQRFEARRLIAGWCCGVCFGLFKRVMGRYAQSLQSYEEACRKWDALYTSEFEIVLDPCEVYHA